MKLLRGVALFFLCIAGHLFFSRKQEKPEEPQQPARRPLGFRLYDPDHEDAL